MALNFGEAFQTGGSALGSIIPDDRARAAAKELGAAEANYRAAENRLIKARRENAEATRAWREFHFPSQSDPT